jgi:L(+)-tartrate dehydratase beta subunit
VRAALWLDELKITQTMWVLEVQRFGLLLVERDPVKNSLLEAKNREVNVSLAKLYKGLKAPGLSRYGEINDRAQELI